MAILFGRKTETYQIPHIGVKTERQKVYLGEALRTDNARHELSQDGGVPDDKRCIKLLLRNYRLRKGNTGRNLAKKVREGVNLVLGVFFPLNLFDFRQSVFNQNQALLRLLETLYRIFQLFL